MVFTYGTQLAPHLGILEFAAAAQHALPWRALERARDMSAASLSPRGDWIAYQSQQSGEYQVYVDRFPGLDDPKQVSGDGGGSHPVWSADGRELFFNRLDGAMMAVQVTITPALEIVRPTMLFENKGYGRGARAGGGGSRVWDLAPDGRFLLSKESAPSTAAEDSIVVVQNWSEELKRPAPDP